MVWILTLAVAAGVTRRFDLLPYLLFAGAAGAWFRRGPRGAALLVVLAAACGAIGFHATSAFERDRAAVERAAAAAGAARVPLDGLVVGHPQASVHGTSFEFETVVAERRVRLQVRAERFDVDYGDRYRLRARFVKPTPSGRAFLASRGLSGSARVRSSEMVVLGRGGNPVVRECFWPLHRFARTRLSRAMGSDAGLAIGMLLGERVQIAEPVRDAVRRLGITHLLAISGMHLTTVAGCVMLATRRWSRWRTCVLVAALSVYTATVGDVESLTRAYLMSMTLVAMRATLRPLRAVDALATTWFVMTVSEPLSLRSVGLQLSFAATFAVLLCLPLLSSRGERPGSRLARWIRNALRPVGSAFVVSVAVELFIAPLQLHHFHALSAVGPVATVLFFVPVTLVLLGAAPVVALAALLPAHEWPGGFLGGLSTATADLIVACGRIAPPLFTVPEPNPWLYYGGLVLAWRFRRHRSALAAGVAMLVLAFA